MASAIYLCLCSPRSDSPSSRFISIHDSLCFTRSSSTFYFSHSYLILSILRFEIENGNWIYENLPENVRRVFDGVKIKHRNKNVSRLKRLRRNESDEEVLLCSFQRENEIEGDSYVVMLLRLQRADYLDYDEGLKHERPEMLVHVDLRT
ncbi:unnamed protein product [Vicia faba]|uniref:Uncharacterized protein n=1 Tax=Vicia faba TaxID=3906 RepID=A0AAV1BDA4_VICFA|nr:unnamed protein product [Vicia faba]